ncbi:hypothetical protein Lal_00030352 [Lupinus albus]|nr:hypothetical protein Lal_00030352 [Lupinus albus]
MAVAIDQHHGFKPFSRSQRCKLQSFGHLDHNILELTHASFSHSFEQVFEADNIHRSFSTPCLPLSTLSGEDLSTSNPRIEIVSGSGALVHALVVEVAIAMASSVHPKPFPSGLGGAYVFCNKSGNNIALAKPVDEEPLAFNNPKGLGGQKLGQPGLKSSIRIGETGVRELAAYLLDHGGFVGVPPTALDYQPKLPNMPKLASLQRSIGYSFDIGILDIRLLNLDRHAGNMLVMKHNHNSYVAGVAADLVSIDHGFCLPEWLDDPYFEWLHRPQASTVAISDNLWNIRSTLVLSEFPSSGANRKPSGSSNRNILQPTYLGAFGMANQDEGFSLKRDPCRSSDVEAVATTKGLGSRSSETPLAQATLRQ